MFLLLAVSAWAIPPCLMHQVQPPGLEVLAPLGDQYVPRGSIVLEHADEDCGEQVAVEVISSVYYYAKPGKEHVPQREMGCIDRSHLQSLEGFELYVMAPPPAGKGSALQPGAFLAPLELASGCAYGTVLMKDKTLIALDNMRWVRPLDPHQKERTEEIQEAWAAKWGEGINGRVWVNDWGRIYMPLTTVYGPERLAREWKRESMETDAQKEKALVSEGPGGIYAHFLGSDARFSDLWGVPVVINTYADLMVGWNHYCTNALGKTKAQCLVQIGDIAWYNHKRPDPLGHQNHFGGNCVDLRLFRTDLSRYEADWNRPDDREGYGEHYDPKMTQAFVSYVRENFPVGEFFFNDPEIKGVAYSKGHDDHLHLCLGVN